MTGVDSMVIVAFEKGVRAAEAERARSSNPYMPWVERELYESWNCGFDEAEPRYRVAK